MSMNSTPRGERTHIAILGRRNAGKSSVINALTNQEISIVSHIKGTTTDPVYKAMELLPIGPVVFIDTAGLDDKGTLGELRIEKTYNILNKTDLALLVIDATVGINEFEDKILKTINEKKVSVIGVVNKIDEVEDLDALLETLKGQTEIPLVPVSATQKIGIDELKTSISDNMPKKYEKFQIVGDLLNPGDFVVLVTPIDKAAPKGRLILPQQQVIRDILESDAIAIVTKEYELRETLENIGKKPKMVITDSQVFAKVSADTPKDILLTSFSILFARYKGDLLELVKGAKVLDSLENGDKILMAEGCTHHVQCDDIGRVKIPRWIRQYAGKKLEFEFFSGTHYPKDVDSYKLIIHCGGCMLNKKEMQNRIAMAKENKIPIVNYGVLIAYVQGILKRAIEPFPLVSMELSKQK